MSNSGSLTISSPLAPSPAEAQPFPSSQQQDNLQITKDIMEWVFAVAAAVLIVSLIVWRCTRLRRGNRPLHEFFRTQSCMDYTPGEFSGRQVSRFPPDDVRNSLTYGPILSPVPLVHRGEVRRLRRTRAADIDARGRRGPIRHPDFPHEEALPAYDDKDVPPKYHDLESGTGPAPVEITRASPSDDAGRVQATSTQNPLVARIVLPANELEPGFAPEPSASSSPVSDREHEWHAGSS